MLILGKPVWPVSFPEFALLLFRPLSSSTVPVACSAGQGKRGLWERDCNLTTESKIEQSRRSSFGDFKGLTFFSPCLRRGFNCRKGRIRAVFRWGPRIDVLSAFFRISLDSKIIFFSFTDIHLHYSLDIHLHFILFTFIFFYCYYHYYGYNNNNNY